MQSIPHVQYREVCKVAGNCAKFEAGVVRGRIKLRAEICSSRAAIFSRLNLKKVNEKWTMQKITKSIVNGSRGTGKTTLRFAFYALLV